VVVTPDSLADLLYAALSEWWWLDPLDGVHAVNGSLKGRYLAHPGALGAGDKVGLGEVDAISLVHLNRSEK